jgi:PAS domain S-box-containing protein
MNLPTNSTSESLNLLYSISRELVSALELRIVLQRVLSRSLEIVEASSASIIILDDKQEPVDAAIIVDGNVHDGSVERLKSTLESGLAGWVVRNREAALVQDTSVDPRWTKRGYEDDQKSAKSSLCAPLIARDQLVGVITLTHAETGYYTSQHLDLVQAIADQAAIAALNAQLFEASQRRANVMSLLVDISASITSTLELDEVLNRILEQTSRALEVDVVTLGLVDRASGDVTVQKIWGQAEIRQVGQRFSRSEGVPGWVVKHGEEVKVSDLADDERFRRDEPVKGHYAVAAAPIKTEDEVVGVLEAIKPQGEFTSDDMLLLQGISGLAGTAIRHARLFQEVQLAHARFRQLFEDSIDMIFISDWDGGILEANLEALELTRYSREELLEMQVYHFIEVDWNVVGFNFVNLRTGQRETYETYLQPSAGPSFPVEVHVHRVTIDDQDGLQWIMRDITDLRKSELLREDLTSMIYHDLRSPLANVVSGLDLIRTMVPDEEGIESVLRIAERSIGRIQRLISSLLDTSRLQAGHKITTMQPTVVQQLIAEAIETVRPAADASNFIINLDQPEDPLTMMIDADMIRRVMINLLENAIKYSPEGRHIHVTVEEKDAALSFSVQDEGRGISEEDQEHVFERFMRADLTAKRARGIGLGLAFCKLAVEGHRGRIWVESELGKGSRFTFTLPLEQ